MSSAAKSLKEIQISRDSAIASLAILSKASSDAAISLAEFFRTLESNADTSDGIKELVSSLSLLGSSIVAIDEKIPALALELSVTGKKSSEKKKKVERDPNAPRKPLTAFFAYSATVRDKIRADRAKKGQPVLGSVEMTQIISQQWKEMSEEQKEEWKKKYYDELVGYNAAFEKYLNEKSNGTLEPVTESPEKKKSKKRKQEDTEISEPVTELDESIKHEKSESERKKEKKEKKKKKKLEKQQLSQ